MRSVRLRGGACVPVLGQGAWSIGECDYKREAEVAALRAGCGAGMTLIDTAEMYGDGRSERLVGEAIRGMDRDSVFLVSKVVPANACCGRMRQSCEATLRNLGVYYLDLYLLHWPGCVPLAETVECLEELVRLGYVRRWGVSNFDISDMKKLWAIPHGANCAVNQVLYHLGSRGIEYDLMPWLRERGVPVMAYCPIAQAGELNGSLYKSKAVADVAARHEATVPQILLAFATHSGDVIAIPKSGCVEHTMENAESASIRLTETDLTQLNEAFPPPHSRTRLDII